jgi:uncharacterized protein
MSAFAIPGDTKAAPYRLFDTPVGPHLLVIPQSRIFALDPQFAEALLSCDPAAHREVTQLAEEVSGELSLASVPEPPPQSISLNVSASCNLACAYCYAGRGGFGGRQTAAMTWETARAAIDRLLTLADKQAPVTIGFLGGEPFINRQLIRQVVEYAENRGGRRGFDIRFSVTTNGTVLTAEDCALIRAHRFGVTISVDGGRSVHDAQRPGAGGRSSFSALIRAVAPLLSDPGRAKLTARATVVHGDFDLVRRFEEIMALGFPEAGFAPLRIADDAALVLRGDDWERYLAAMTTLADAELDRLRKARPIRLTNLAVAIKQLHRGFSMPYPCGAGGGYFSVGADGVWYACHRAVGQESFALGDNHGLDHTRRRTFLRERHVHAQAACRSCWARYLCSGGCHQEASARTDSSCGFIRGWLDYCLRTYAMLIREQPQCFAPSELNRRFP